MPFSNNTHQPPRALRESWGVFLKRFLVEDAAITSIEYLFMLSLVIFACMIGIGLVGTKTLAFFELTRSRMP